MKATAKAPANIAFIKYWGKKNEKLNLPLSSSISMNLSRVFTTTTVEFAPVYKKDVFEFTKEKATFKEKGRVFDQLDRIRKKTGITQYAKVISENNFPKGIGIASSAAGFAALTLAGTSAAGLSYSQKGLSILARLGSGSACRSIPDGFVEWKMGVSSETSYARSIFPPEYWDLRNIVVIVGGKEKKISSTEGHRLAPTSPFFKERISVLEAKVKKMKRLIKEKRFTEFGIAIEEEAINMHTIMMTSKPPIFYWLPKTLEIMRLVWQWREKGLKIYFTIDAGPTLHLICQGRDEKRVLAKLGKIRGIRKIVSNKPAKGAYLVTNHLF